MMQYKRLLQNYYIRIALLLLSIGAHLCLGLAFGGGRFESDKVPHTISVELLKVASLDPVVKASQFSGTPREKNDGVAHHAMSPLTLRENVSTLATVQTNNISEMNSFLPVVTSLEPYYFPISDLTEAPQVTLDLSPSLVFSLPNGVGQLAILRLLLNEQGGVDQVLVDDSPLSEDGQQLVIDTFSKTKFQPGKINSMPVKSLLKIEVRLDAGFDQ